jgi:centromere protein C
MIEPKAAANNDWFFQKVFGDGDFIAAGHLIIPPQGRKPSKGTKDNTYVRFTSTFYYSVSDS